MISPYRIGTFAAAALGLSCCSTPQPITVGEQEAAICARNLLLASQGFRDVTLTYDVKRGLPIIELVYAGEKGQVLHERAKITMFIDKMGKEVYEIYPLRESDLATRHILGKIETDLRAKCDVNQDYIVVVE